AETSTRSVRRSVTRGNVDRRSFSDPADERRVVVRMARVRIPRAEGVNPVEEKGLRREKARGPFRVPVELVRGEARGRRPTEIVGPCKLREQLPVDREEIAVRLDFDVARPHVFSRPNALLHELQRVVGDRHASVEQQDELRPCVLDARTPCLEPPSVRFRDDTERNPISNPIPYNSDPSCRRTLLPTR